jgi:hypothetical protein
MTFSEIFCGVVDGITGLSNDVGQATGEVVKIVQRPSTNVQRYLVAIARPRFIVPIAPELDRE